MNGMPLEPNPNSCFN